MGGKFSWFKVDVLPVVAAVAAGCTAAVYSIARNLYTNPDVHLTYDTRGDPVPENDKISKRAEGYSSSFYRGVQSKKENTKIFG
ncbi:hypothetical protein PSENEW3n2_00002230 [Picochlorum sp. SENEW3]|nr:hypothetical protein M9435_001814 [Picochlorum sp. BPE23]WPT11059.1 hypothetical protein PSENEW3n2_00002230 [Picochlorum sp. SENEW3]WPT15867.1 hypothetical protein PSENEW3_00002230 [Picochlorum sp. SENEW3]